MNQDSLKELAALCQQLRDAERGVETCEKDLKDAKELVRKLIEEDIPALMQELGVSKLVLESGEQVTVGTEVYASLSKEKKTQAYEWLEANGFGGLIKTDLTLSFGRDELEKAVELAKELTEQRGMAPVLDRAVHAGTLKAFIKERLEAGAEFPMDLFGARAVSTAKIKEPTAAARRRLASA